MHAWEEWGEECFSRFNGQWALALWDRRDERLVLSRDRLGVRPLFFTRDRHRLRLRFGGQGDLRRPLGRRAPSTLWARRDLRPTGRRSRPARSSAGSSSSSRASSPSSTATDSARRPYWQHRTSPQRGTEPGQDTGRTPSPCASASSRRPGCGSCAATCPSGPTCPAASTPRSPPPSSRGTPTHPCTPSRCGSPTRSSTRGVHQHRMVARARRPSTTRSSSRHADIAEVFPEVVRHAETPVLRAAPAPLLPAVAAGARERLQGRGDRRGRRRGARRLRHLPRGAGPRVLGPRPGLGRRAPAPRAALPVDGPLPRPARRRSRAASSAATSTPPTPRLAPAAVDLHRQRRRALLSSDLRAELDRARRTWSPRDAARQRRLGPAQPRPVAGDDDAAARLHPLLARATGC